MRNDAVFVSLVSVDCEDAIGDEKEPKEMLRKAFNAAKHHFMVTEADPQLKGALNAVLKKMGDDHPDRKRLELDIRLLSQFNAFLQAAQSGLNVDAPEIPEGHESFGIMKLWHAAA